MSARLQNTIPVVILAACFLLPASGCSWLGQLVPGSAENVIDRSIHRKERKNETPDQKSAREAQDFEDDFYNDFHREERREEIKRRYPPAEPGDLLFERTF